MGKSFLKLGIALSVLMAVFLLLPHESAQAATPNNIRGLAYNTNYGYISFNCLDDGFAGRFTFTFTFPFWVPPCTYNNHGVTLDDADNFSGDAWNSRLGFITFTASSTPSDTFRAKCNGCTAAAGCTACYNEAEGIVYGYMYIQDYNEWIKLDGPDPVRITNYLTANPGIFSGYATSSPTIGPVSFNCTNEPGSCALNPYEVKIGPLEIRQQTAPNWDYTNACCINCARGAILKWNRRSGTQSAFRVIVSTANSTSTGVIVDYQASSTANQYSFAPPGYDTPYYWFLKLWDTNGSSTPWRQFNADGITKDWITNNFSRNTTRSGADAHFTFTTYRYEFPQPVFTWTPATIVIATTSNSFISNSVYFNSANPNTPQSCTTLTCNFAWSVTNDPAATILSPTAATTSIMFTKATSTIVSLTTTDTSDPAIYTCSTSTTLDINYALPLWKEIKAP